MRSALKPIKTITDSVLSITDLVVEILKIFPNLVLAIMTYIKDPSKLIESILHGIKEGIMVLFTGTVGSLSSGPKKAEKKTEDKSNTKTKYCFKTRLLKILLMIGFPPLAIFVDRGFRGFIPIIISSVLTFYFYYFPGLIFTSIYLLL